MRIDEISQLLSAAAALVSAVIWPVVALVLLAYFGPALRVLIREAREITVKAAGIEAAVKKTQVAAALGAASVVNKKASFVEGESQDSWEIARVVNKAVDTGTIERIAEAQILWVDDQPSNNLYERRALEALGITIDISTSTEDALVRLQSGSYDLLISDMGRPSDNRAGYTLLREMRQQGFNQPFVIYASSNRPEHKAEARRRGAAGSTNNATELFKLVTRAIQNAA